MATTISTPNSTTSVATGVGVALQVNLPRECNRVAIQPITVGAVTTAHVAYSGTDGVALGDDAHPIILDQIIELDVPRPARGTPAIYLQTDAVGRFVVSPYNAEF